MTVIRDEQQKVFFFAKQGENYIPLRIKRSEQQRAKQKSSNLEIIYVVLLIYKVCYIYSIYRDFLYFSFFKYQKGYIILRLGDNYEFDLYEE